MPQVELSARFLLAAILCWCVFPPAPRYTSQSCSGFFLALAACALSAAADLHQTGAALVCLALVASGTALGLGAAAADDAFEPRAARAVRPVLAAVLGCLAGQGALLPATGLALALVVLENALHASWPFEKAGADVCRIKIRAQGLRGIVGRVETVLDRLGIRPLSMTVGHDVRDKEMTIVMQLAIPPGRTAAELVSALQEVEGVIQFAWQ